MMFDNRRVIALVLFVAIAALASYSLSTPQTYAVPAIHMRSRQENGATVNKGTVDYNGATGQSLPLTAYPPEQFTVTYHPEAGYVFVRWEVDDPDAIVVSSPNSATTEVHREREGTITAVYQRSSVGGILLPTSTIALLTPYLAFAAATVMAVFAAKKRLG